MNARRPQASPALNLSLRHLRAVQEVAAFGSFTAAAASLGVSQPGVSRLVGQVERELGVPVFLRSTRRVVLTPAGREFVHSIERFLEDLDAQVENTRSQGGHVRGRLVVSCLSSLTHHMVPDALVEYRRRNPGVEVHLRERMGTEVYEDVRSGIADFGVGNAVGLADEILAEETVHESCVGLLPAGHPLADLPELSLHHFVREPLVSLPPVSGLRRLIDGTAAMHGITLDHMMIVEQFGSIFDFVAAGLGLSIVPPSALPARLADDLLVKPIVAPPILRQIAILRLRERGLTPAAQGFLDLFRPRFARAEHLHNRLA